jgi:hypothetical protein
VLEITVFLGDKLAAYFICTSSDCCIDEYIVEIFNFVDESYILLETFSDEKKKKYP